MVLLDEIEKAHADVYNILLQVMDHGVLTDSNGKKVDFRNVVLIMTTNAGASDAQRQSIGFGRDKVDDEDEAALKRLFTPEFRNRLDAVVAFKPLTPEIIRQVVQKFVLQLEAQLADRNVTISLSGRRRPTGWPRTASTSSTARGPWRGSSRSTSRSRWPTTSCSDDLVRGGHVKVVLKDSKIAFEIESNPEKPGKASKSEDEAEPALAE